MCVSFDAHDSRAIGDVETTAFILTFLANSIYLLRANNSAYIKPESQTTCMSIRRWRAR
jgi:hypothetical protein